MATGGTTQQMDSGGNHEKMQVLRQRSVSLQIFL